MSWHGPFMANTIKVLGKIGWMPGPQPKRRK